MLPVTILELELVKYRTANAISSILATFPTGILLSTFSRYSGLSSLSAVFGNIKQNMNFRRFMLRGIDNVNVETGHIAMAHNLKKYGLAI